MRLAEPFARGDTILTRHGRIERVASACANAGNISKTVAIALDIGQLIYEIKCAGSLTHRNQQKLIAFGKFEEILLAWWAHKNSNLGPAD